MPARSRRGSSSRLGKDYRTERTGITDPASGHQAHEYANTIHCDACRTWKYTHRHASRRFDQWINHLSRHHRKS